MAEFVFDICKTCRTAHYHGESCPVCYHNSLERKAAATNEKALQCPKCGYKFNYLVVCNPYTVKLKPECGCFAFQEVNPKPRNVH